MKYAQILMGLLAGTALGGAVVASQGGALPGQTPPNEEAIKQIVRDTIAAEPQLILDSVNRYQQAQQEQAGAKAGEALKDKDVRDAIFNDDSIPQVGKKGSDKVVAEFFDYDCPVCKMQFKILADLLKKDPELRVVLHEFPIFGPVSETNSKIGLAVNHLYPEKYWEFHEKMMEGKGHETDNTRTWKIVEALGMDRAKVEAWSTSEDATKQLDKSREIGGKLNIRGTPTLVIGEEVIGHAVEAAELESKLNK